MFKIIKTEGVMVVAGGWRGERMGSYYLTVMKFQFYRMKSITGMDGDDVCTMM